jgi:hypothetical protein
MIEKTVHMAHMNCLKNGGHVMLAVNSRVEDGKILCINKTGSQSLMADIIEYKTTPTGLLYAIVQKSVATV